MENNSLAAEAHQAVLFVRNNFSCGCVDAYVDHVERVCDEGHVP